MAVTDIELCKCLPWDTSFFGKRIARILPTNIRGDQVREVFDWARENVIDCVYFLCESNDNQSVQLAEKSGFHLVDLRITKEIDGIPNAEVNRVVGVRRVTQNDIPALKALARDSHTDSRFYYDKKFNSELSTALYEHWIEKSCNGWADAVFVACQDDQSVGYVSCHLDGEGVGRIGLLSVSSLARGQGFGTALVSEALAWFKQEGIDKVIVVTQGRNIAAQRLYERCGFLTKAAQLWYHRWAPFEVKPSF